MATDGDWIESKDQDPDGEVRLIQLADVGDGRFVDKSRRFLTSATAGRLNCTFLVQNDVLIARMPDPLGRACVYPGVGGPAVTAVDVFICQPSEGVVEPRWLMHFINSPDRREAMLLQAGGTTRQRIAGGRIKQLEIPTPPMREQRRIVAKIESLSVKSSRARDHLDRIHRLVEKYKQAVLAAAFLGELTPSRQSFSPCASDINKPIERSFDTNAPHALPPNWTWQSVEALSDVGGGLTKNAARREIVARRPYLRVANVYANELRLDDITEIGCTDREFERTRLRSGDLLVVEGNGSLD